MKIKKISIKFEIGQMVYSKTDNDQYERQVTGFMIREERVIYYVTHDSIESSFYGFELTEEKDMLKSLS